MIKYIKLSQWAINNNYTYQGAYRLFRRGLIPNTKTLPTGTILVQCETEVNTYVDNNTNHCVIYCRVSSSKQKDDLQRQIERMTNFATNNGYIVKHVYKEIASGMNDNRRELTKLLENNNNCKLLIEHKDRLTRFGYNYLSMLCGKLGIDIIVTNESISEKDELVNDLITVVTSFCARLYGNRKSSRKTDSIIKVLTTNNE